MTQAVAGIDIGSQTAKSVILLDGKVAELHSFHGIYSEKTGIDA